MDGARYFDSRFRNLDDMPTVWRKDLHEQPENLAGMKPFNDEVRIREVQAPDLWIIELNARLPVDLARLMTIVSDFDLRGEVVRLSVRKILIYMNERGGPTHWTYFNVDQEIFEETGTELLVPCGGDSGTMGLYWYE